MSTTYKKVRTWKQLLADPRVREVYAEHDDGFLWYWVELNNGFTVDGCCSIHEIGKARCITRMSEIQEAGK